MIPAVINHLPVDFAFRANRDYVQAPQIFDALLRVFKPRASVSLEIHHVIRRQIELVFATADEKEASGVMANFEYAVGQEVRVIYVRERPGTQITSREPYDEDAIIANGVLHGNEVHSPRHGQGTFVERVTALNKILLESVLGSQHTWWFTKIELERVPTDDASLSIKFVTAVGFRLTKSKIIADGTEVGTIYFSEKPKQ
ncbi:MAG: hypothetical protein ACRD19_03955 [Terriglobia bacterium]